MNLKEYYKILLEQQLIDEGSRGVKRLARKAEGIANKMRRHTETYPSISDSTEQQAAAELAQRANDALVQIYRAVGDRVARARNAEVSSSIGDKPARVLDARLIRDTGKSLRQHSETHTDMLRRASETLTGNTTISGAPMPYNISGEEAEKIRATGRFTLGMPDPGGEAARRADEREEIGRRNNELAAKLQASAASDRRFKNQDRMAELVRSMNSRALEAEAARHARAEDQATLLRVRSSEEARRISDAREDRPIVTKIIDRVRHILGTSAHY